MAGYIYSDISDGCEVEIKGQKIIRRGRAVLGLRANFLKTNYFEDIKGEIHTKKGCVIFSASRAEWMMASDSPIVLQDTVKISINNKNIPAVRTVHIYPKSGMITIRTDKVQTYNFRH